MDLIPYTGMIEQILPAYDYLKETISAVMIFYRDTKAKVQLHSVDI